MIERLESVLDTARHAAQLVIDDVADVSLGWVLAAVALHFLSQGVRTLGWFNILRAAYPSATGLRRRQVIGAYLAGSGLNGVIPARGGDLVKVGLLHRRIEGSRYSTLIATFVPETLFETAFGVGLVVWALANGFLPVPTSPGELPSVDVSLFIDHPFISSTVAAALAAGGWLVVRRLRRNARTLVERIKQGLAIFRRPRDYVGGVVTWQALGRVIRLGSLACFIAAFGLPLTFGTAVLVMAAQGGGRIIPLAPASAGLRLAMLSYGFVEITGEAVDIASITAFTFGVGFVLMVSALAVSLGVLFHELGTLSPRRAFAVLRARLAHAEAGASP
jgi:Lysylphosphatidylglycerol synthase TM region